LKGSCVSVVLIWDDGDDEALKKKEGNHTAIDARIKDAHGRSVCCI
jgi:hypothetical protein